MLVCGALIGASSGLAAEPGFAVRLGEGIDGSGAGRVVVYLIGPGAGVPDDASPADAPFYEEPQPLYGMDIGADADRSDLRVTDATAMGYPGPMAGLSPGEYRAQAVLDRRSEFGAWRREAGNLYSEVVPFRIGEDGAWPEVVLTLDRVVGAARGPRAEGVAFFEVHSSLLSEFRGRPTAMRAGVVTPLGYMPGEAYPALYVVSGFGGNHSMADRVAMRQRRLTPGTPEHTMASSAFTIVIDADGPYGHTLLADSANNGPVGRALIEELIPALEKEYNLIARPEARLLNGHSSGGWTTLWLATEYPGIFGAAWSSAPDPVDFHAFQKVNIYDDVNLFYRNIGSNEAGAAQREPIASYTEDGQVLMTIVQEAGVEHAMGPRNSSGQQWHSWMAVFGPRAADGRPADLFDPVTGEIDPAVAARFRPFDITARLEADPGRFGPLFRERIRLVVGDADSYDLHPAVIRLKGALDRVSPQLTAEATAGSITIVPGADHGTVLGSDAVRAWPADMVTHLRRAGLSVREADAP
jgi:hypothetical protein